jgi:uncharacterized protein DUF748
VSRRGLRLGLIAAVAIVALVVGVIVALPQIVRRIAIWQLGAATGRTVTLAAVEIDLFRGRLGVRGLSIVEREGGPLAGFDRLDVRFRPGALLRGHLHVVDGTLKAPIVRLVRTGPGVFNVSDLVAARRGGGGRAGAVTVDRFRVVDGALLLEDRAVTPSREWRVDSVTLDVRDASTVASRPSGGATLTASVTGGPLSLVLAELKLAPLHFRATLTAQDVDASLSALLLPPGPVLPPRGTISATATVDQDASTGALVTLGVRLAGVELRRAGDSVAFVSAPLVRLSVDGLRLRPGAVELARAVVDGGTVTVLDARLGGARRWRVEDVGLQASALSSARDAPPGMAQASATMAGARLTVWAANIRLAPLELHATTIVRDVDLALLGVSLPPDLPVQPERGVVNATVRLDHDAVHGTRLALDAGLAGIELRRPKHFVTSPAVRVTAADIGFDHGAVTVGEVTIGGDRVTLEDRSVTPARTWLIQGLAVEAKALSSRREDVQGTASLRAVVSGASVSAWVTHARLDPLELHVTTILRNIDVALLQLYVPVDAPLQLERGIVNASVEVDHSVDGGTRVNGDATVAGLETRGRGAVASLGASIPSMRLALADVRRQGTALSVGRVELTGSGSLTDTRTPAARVDLAELRVATEGLTWPAHGPARVEVSARFRDRGELEARGTAQLTAPPPAIGWSADVALRLRAVDLAPVAAALPAASGVGGRVHASLTGTVAYASDALSVRVRGDAGANRLALVDGGRTLVGARRVDVRGVDVQWPERVAVDQVRLLQPAVLLERDRQGALPLVARFARRSPDGEPPPPAAGRPPMPALAIGEVVVDGGSAVVVDERPATVARLEVSRVGLTVRDLAWPASKPATLKLDAGLPGGGSFTAQGTLNTEPLAVDLTLALADVEVAALQPYLGFRAAVRARVDANLAVVGPLAPSPRVSIHGDAGVRQLVVSDGQRPALTVERIAVTGVDVAWPERVAVDRVRVGRSWALAERDRQGGFLLRQLFERAGAGASPPAPVGGAGAQPVTTAFSVREVTFEQQGATIVDGTTTPPARIEIAGASLTVQDLRWPSRGPMKLELNSPMPAGGRLKVAGTLELEPIALEAKAVLEDVALQPAQAYLPIEGRIAGGATGELTVKVTAEPLGVQIAGQTRVRRFSLSDGERPIVTVGRVEAMDVDVDWPRRIAVGTVLFRYPQLLIERDAQGDIVLRRLVTPRRAGTDQTPGAPSAPRPPAGSSAPAAEATTIEVATLRLERASARFVDQTTTPPYAEELSNVELVVSGLTTAPGRRARFTGSGGVGGGSFKLTGEAAQGNAPFLDLKVDLRDFVVPRANAYIDRFTAWTATRGSLSVSAAYTLNGTRLDARHDVVVRNLEVAQADERDEVERRLGLPFGFLVSLLKDARGEIRLSLPVSGDLGKREFDFEDSMWSAVRSVAIRLLALPFSRIGSLFFSEDSKVEAVAITPIVFEAGTTRLAPEMESHVQRVASFLRGAPSVTAVLRPILTQADVDALRQEHPPEATSEAMRELGAARLEAVRQSLARLGGVDASRLPGNVPRRPLVESAGAARVELDLRQ